MLMQTLRGICSSIQRRAEVCVLNNLPAWYATMNEAFSPSVMLSVRIANRPGTVRQGTAAIRTRTPHHPVSF